MNGNKKILIFSTAYLPLIGGAELAIKEITDRIPAYDFFMITTRFSRSHPRRERIGNIEIYRVGTGVFPLFDKLLSSFLGAWTARKLMKEHSFFLFWSMMVTFTSGAPFLLRFFHLHKKIPILLTLQEGDSEAHLTYSYFGLMFLVWKAALGYADRITVISRYLEQLARKRGASSLIDIIPNGVAIAHFEERKPEKEHALKEKFGKKEGDIFIITTSRLVLKNAVDDGIKSLQHLPGHIKFLVLGKGTDEEKLRKFSHDLQLADRVIFAGEVMHADIPSYLHISDIYLRPSLSEGLGSAFLEAMAAGLPVIATEVGGIPDFLTDRVTGLYCKVRDPKDIAEKIKMLSEDSVLRQNIIMNAKKMVEEKYNWDIVSADMNRVFNTATYGI